MKKRWFVVLAACFTLFVACNSAGGFKNITIPENFVTYENENYAIRYPNDMVVTWSDGFLNAECHGAGAQLDAAFVSDAPTRKQLKQYARSLIYVLKYNEETCNAPIIKSGVLTLRSENENTVKHHFFVLEGNGSGVLGSFSYSKEMAGTWDAYVAPVIASIQFK